MCSARECDSGRQKVRSGFGLGISWEKSITWFERENGHVTHRFVFDANTGQLEGEVAMGPFGKTEETDYTEAKLRCRQIFSYDQYRHVTERLTLDNTGQQKGKI